MAKIVDGSQLPNGRVVGNHLEQNDPLIVGQGNNMGVVNTRHVDIWGVGIVHTVGY